MLEQRIFTGWAVAVVAAVAVAWAFGF
jgi:hypothetical protein